MLMPVWEDFYQAASSNRDSNQPRFDKIRFARQVDAHSVRGWKCWRKYRVGSGDSVNCEVGSNHSITHLDPLRLYTQYPHGNISFKWSITRRVDRLEVLFWRRGRGQHFRASNESSDSNVQKWWCHPQTHCISLCEAWPKEWAAEFAAIFGALGRDDLENQVLPECQKAVLPRSQQPQWALMSQCT